MTEHQFEIDEVILLDELNETHIERIEVELSAREKNLARLESSSAAARVVIWDARSRLKKHQELGIKLATVKHDLSVESCGKGEIHR
jgi:hypothetical protein